MTIRRLAALSVAPLLLLAGCDDDTVATSTDRITPAAAAASPSPSPSPSRTGVGTELGLEILRDNDRFWGGLDDDVIANASAGVCFALNEGHSLDSMFTAGLSEGIPAESLGALYAYAVNVDCPDQTPALNEWIASP